MDFHISPEQRQMLASVRELAREMVQADLVTMQNDPIAEDS